MLSLDVYLMYMSKGGLNLDILNRLGVRTKDFYLQSYIDLYNRLYGDKNKKLEESDTDLSKFRTNF